VTETKAFAIPADRIGQIVEALPSDYRAIGPVKEKWAVNLGTVNSGSDLATGLATEEKPGTYKLVEGVAFDLSGARPMTSPKWFTHRPYELLYRTKRGPDGELKHETPADEPPKQAFFGLHACDVSGMYVLDRTFEQKYTDPLYQRRRQNTIIIGQNCLNPGSTCFCSTFDTGPGLKGGFDIGLTYLDGEYLVETATATGAEIVSRIEAKPAAPAMITAKINGLRQAKRTMTRAFDLKRGVDTLNANYNHPYWSEPSARCLSCANCINVCPTCYCYRIADKTTIDLSESRRTRVWDACQHLEFAAVHGGNFRPERVDRIRQWVNHKINWTIEQYGCAGCVGCGRCITWCPTMIDITEPVWRLGGKDVSLAA
jgi:sulfhydrogenase subunit beta (sulfur reductase)